MVGTASRASFAARDSRDRRRVPRGGASDRTRGRGGTNNARGETNNDDDDTEAVPPVERARAAHRRRIRAGRGRVRELHARARVDPVRAGRRRRRRGRGRVSRRALGRSGKHRGRGRARQRRAGGILVLVLVLAGCLAVVAPRVDTRGHKREEETGTRDCRERNDVRVARARAGVPQRAGRAGGARVGVDFDD